MSGANSDTSEYCRVDEKQKQNNMRHLNEREYNIRVEFSFLSLKKKLDPSVNLPVFQEFYHTLY